MKGHAISIKAASTIVVSALFALAEGVSAQAFSVEQLEQGFADDRELAIINSAKQLPVDVLQAVGFKNTAVADLGELWHAAGNVDDPSTMPTAQHIFSAVSDRYFFVLVQRPRPAWGRRGENVRLLLGERNAHQYCAYTYRNLTLGLLRLDSFQSDFNRRDRVTAPTHSTCEVQSAS